MRAKNAIIYVVIKYICRQVDRMITLNMGCCSVCLLTGIIALTALLDQRGGKYSSVRADDQEFDDTKFSRNTFFRYLVLRFQSSFIYLLSTTTLSFRQYNVLFIQSTSHNTNSHQIIILLLNWLLFVLYDGSCKTETLYWLKLSIVQIK